MRRLRMLYVGWSAPGSTSTQRMHALQALGHEVVPFDFLTHTVRRGRIRRAIEGRLAWGPTIMRFNRALAAACDGGPYDVLWIDKGIWVYPRTLERWREQRGIRLIHFTPDPALMYHRTRHFARCIPLYDACVTSKRYELKLYEQYGAKRVLFCWQGFDPTIFRPHDVTAEERARLASDVGFIGHSEPHYVRSVRAAAAVTPRVGVWGNWAREVKRSPDLRPLWRAPGVWGVDYAKAMGCASIGLGLLSRLAPDRHTTRTFEIPACGTFLLAERTEEHQELFEEGREAEFFGDLDELQDKIRYYLAHPDERKRIAAAGRERCLRSGYSYQDRLRQLLGVLDMS